MSYVATSDDLLKASRSGLVQVPMKPSVQRHRGARLFAAAALSWAGNATDTGRLTVTASIANQCLVGNAALAMGSITLVSTGEPW